MASTQGSSVKTTPNGTVIRILGKRKAEDAASASKRSDAEAFYAQMSRIRAEPSREDARRQGSRTLVEQREEAVRERLMAKGECDLLSMTCHMNQCFRGFESVRVLAWHMSYSHTDERDEMGHPWTCLVCGRVMPSIKGKNSHLATGHRDLCVLHNTQCIQQRLPKTEPMSRVLKRRAPEEEAAVAVHGFLLRDELVYDEDSDFEEDVSVPEGTWAADAARSTRALPTPEKTRTSESEATEPVIVVDES